LHGIRSGSTSPSAGHRALRRTGRYGHSPGKRCDVHTRIFSKPHAEAGRAPEPFANHIPRRRRRSIETAPSLQQWMPRRKLAYRTSAAHKLSRTVLPIHTIVLLMPDDSNAPGSPIVPSVSADELQLIVDAMSAMVARCSRDGRYLWVSRAYAEW